MNKFILALAVIVVAVAAQAQGTIRFNNKNQGDAIDAKVSLPDGTGAGAGITAELVLVGAGGSLTPLTPTSTFGSTTAASFYFSNKDVTVPGVATGATATFLVRAYSTSAGSYDAAQTTAGAWWGSSAQVVSAALGGIPAGGGAPVTSPNLKGLTGFTLTQTNIPEPATLALLGLGGAALLIRRRK